MDVIDFSKAFDIIAHSILVSKLRRYNLDSGTTAWVAKMDGLSGSKGNGFYSA